MNRDGLFFDPPAGLADHAHRLVLGRREGETVQITGGIEVTVVKIRGPKVWLAFTAPREIEIHRAERILHGR